MEDNTGKTPLHWAAAKNNFRAFNLLVQAGADEIAVDHVRYLKETTNGTMSVIANS